MAARPVLIGRGQNYVVFSWKDVEALRGGMCVVETLDGLKKWAVVYWGEKKEVKIRDLAPCTCYDFRIRRCDGAGQGTDGGWVEFRGATLEEPFPVMHLTRAVKFAKTALIRKIAHSRPLLLEVENKEMKTPLNQAIEKNDYSLATLLITLGANVNTLSYHTKRSPLMTAVSLGHIPIATLLVDKGCNVNATDINGLNILHYAVDSDNAESVKFALKQGLHVDCKDHNGWTPLMRAAILNCSDDIIRVLLENGASTAVRDKNTADFEKHRQLALKD